MVLLAMDCIVLLAMDGIVSLAMDGIVWLAMDGVVWLAHQFVISSQGQLGGFAADVRSKEMIQAIDAGWSLLVERILVINCCCHLTTITDSQTTNQK